MKQIFITGATGCIGQYIVEILSKNPNYELHLLIRNPDKIPGEWKNNSCINILPGDLQDIESYSDLLLKEINVAILSATSWGGATESYDINVVKTLSLLKMLNPKICEQVLYFSTASILDRNNNLLLEASKFGTDYIRTKYQCLSELSKLEIADKIVALFPTLVFGGDNNKPLSHLSSGLPEIVQWLDLIKWLTADGSFHYIHAQDIAQVVNYLVEHPEAKNKYKNKYAVSEAPIKYLVLGNASITVDKAIADVCQYFNKRIYWRIPLYIWLANILIKLFRIQMDDWSYFSLNYRHFIYQNPVSPATFGLKNYCSSVSDIMKFSGL
ncbi:MAG: NAD(P)-dependent oxidoreductase [Xenococcaceae cyanobacterium MO_234.B1]|nr:NAD(P)-dependent oxidoreductase [Xenococcaceae cyanobacterium MO_234.B1]